MTLPLRKPAPRDINLFMGTTGLTCDVRPRPLENKSAMSAFGGKADIAQTPSDVRAVPVTLQKFATIAPECLRASSGLAAQ